MLTRSEFLAPLIGEPWAWQSRNCWDFACHVQRELFGRALPCRPSSQGASLTGTAMVRNLQNKRFPRLNKNYDYVQFPSLLP
jgi:hypothetical protein